MESPIITKGTHQLINIGHDYVITLSRDHHNVLIENLTTKRQFVFRTTFGFHVKFAAYKSLFANQDWEKFIRQAVKDDFLD